MDLTKNVAFNELIYEYITSEGKVVSTRRNIAYALHSKNGIKTIEEFDRFRDTLKYEYQRQFARTKLFQEFHVDDRCDSIDYQYDSEFFEEGQRLSRRKNRG